MERTARQPWKKSNASIGFVLASEQFPVTELVDLGQAAEQAGFDMVWSSDHFQPWQDNEGHNSFAWVTLAALGQHLQRMALGTGVTCPSFRYHPAIVAEAFATLSQLYPNRVFLGVGAGEALNEQATGSGWGDYAERSGRLREAVELIRKLWSGQEINHQGVYYQMEHARLYDTPAQPIPIYIAASGPKSMRLAGEHGDGLITDAERAVQPALRQAFEDGARAAGKDPNEMPILAEHMVVVGNQQDAEKSAELWRFLPKSWSDYVTDPDPVNIHRRADAEVPLKDVFGKWPISEDPQPHIQAIQKLLDSGVTHIFVHSPQADQRHVIDFYGEQVLPQLHDLSYR